MKYALVTGGSRGIGQAVCLKLAEMGYHILINYQSNDTEAEATRQQIREQGSDRRSSHTRRTERLDGEASRYLH